MCGSYPPATGFVPERYLIELHTQLFVEEGGKRQSWLSMIIEWRSTRVCCTSVPLRDVTLTRPGMDGEAPSRW